jgi:uncharacterized membrane protein YeaQ/YmgE (transglycosylase-associated protein family)
VIARLVAPGRKGPFGFLLTATLGLVGAFAAAALGEEGGWYNRGDPISIVGGLFGAILTSSCGLSGSRAVDPPPRSEHRLKKRRDRCG